MDFLSPELKQLAIILFIACAVGGLVLAIAMPFLSGNKVNSKRIKSSVSSRAQNAADNSRKRSRFSDDPKENRRRQIAESLKQLENDEKKRKKRLNLRQRISQAGLKINLTGFWVMSGILGAVVAVITMILGVPPIISVVAGFVGALGFPRWILGFLRRRRQDSFLNDFADAIDVMVRGLKAGLPINDAMKVIATESGPPVGPEFAEVVEGQKVGITIDQGLARMFEHMPLAEVNFLGIVMAIQAKTGGNLAEALANLSIVLRERKKMKAKIRSVSQEAKSSACIIGALPFAIGGGMMVLNPEYLNPLFDTQLGNIMLAGAACWMGTGVLVMKKMINFDF